MAIPHMYVGRPNVISCVRHTSLVFMLLFIVLFFGYSFVYAAFVPREFFSGEHFNQGAMEANEEVIGQTQGRMELDSSSSDSTTAGSNNQSKKLLRRRLVLLQLNVEIEPGDVNPASMMHSTAESKRTGHHS